LVILAAISILTYFFLTLQNINSVKIFANFNMNKLQYNQKAIELFQKVLDDKKLIVKYFKKEITKNELERNGVKLQKLV